MNKLKKYIALSLVGIGMLTAGCEKIEDFGDTNVDPTKVAVPSTRSLLTNAMQSSTELYIGGGQSATMAQYFSEGPYLTFSGYNNATGGQAYSGFYSGALIQLKKIIDYNEAGSVEADPGANGSKNNQIAVARIMKAFIFWKITDRWGDIPYSEALQGGDNITPKFDKQEDIYADIFKELKEAAAQIDAGLGVQGDIILGGDMNAWKKFAATQRMIMALRMSKVYPAPGGLAATEFNAAMADALASNDDNINYSFIAGDPNNFNPWYDNYTIANRNDYAISSTIVNYMRANGTGTDPRLPVYAEILPGNQIKGLTYGNALQTNIPNAYSRLGDELREQGTPAKIFSFAQVQFAKAEAAKLGWIPGGDAAAKTFYDSGIDASLEQYGVPDPTFKNATGIAYNPATAIQQIATQRWTHLFLDGWEGWAEWRRTGFPALAPGENSANPGGIPRRLMYPASDKTVNTENYEAVLTQQGPDNLDTRMWWDK